jgi:hypothetical protein
LVIENVDWFNRRRLESLQALTFYY